MNPHPQISSPCFTKGLICALATFAAAWTASAEPISLKSLLPEMTDLSKMSEFPNPAYTCKQFSSYDRASKTPDDPKGWFANGDCGQYLRVEDVGVRKEYVMMDAQGPGAIVQIWSTWGTNPDGVLRFYIDGAAEPALEVRMTELLGGKYPGLPMPIAGEYSKGWNLYLPIPYAGSCKVTSSFKNIYYHLDYRTYPAGTAVESFSASQIPALETELKTLATRLAAPAELNKPAADAETKRFSTLIAPGESVSLGSFTGTKAIRLFRLNWKPTADREETALRALVLSMSFDGENCVESPLGDFFGSAPGINPYDSLPLSVTREGRMDCRWVMPFKNAAEIKLRNSGKAPVQIEGEVALAPYPWSNATMHFHAKWRMDHDRSTEPKIDWNYMTATGKGVFAGVAFNIDNPVKKWWGEGDEKIYVDGESFPSHFGTGTEDYYGYAWCWGGLFRHAYHNQTRCDGPGNFGRTSLNRFDILDRIPFTRQFRFDMELWHWAKCNVNLSVIDYWYAAPGATDGFKPIQVDDVTLRPMPKYVPATVKGAIEGETMKILEKSAGQPKPQPWYDASGDLQLWWMGGQQPGDKLVLGFDVPEAGNYRIVGQFLKAVDYGIARFALNDEKPGAPIDFYQEKAKLTGELELAKCELKSGENRLTITITGSNPQAKPSHMIGLDYIRLERLP